MVTDRIWYNSDRVPTDGTNMILPAPTIFIISTATILIIFMPDNSGK